MRIKGVALTALGVGMLFYAPSRPSRSLYRLESRTLSATLDEKGFLLEPPGWGLSPSAWGRAGAMEPLVRRSPRREGARVVYPRPGILEWHEARPEGIEQGFEVFERPPGEGPLVVEQEVRGGLALQDARSDGILFGPPLVSYAGLKAFDASGRSLPARMRLSGRRLALEVDDADAAYPVRIDPMSTTPSTTVKGNQYSWLGWSVASAGDVNGDGYSDLVVGAPEYENAYAQEGRAYLYHGGASGLGTTVRWSADGGQAADSWGFGRAPGFGTTVDSAGDVNGDGYSDVIVGSPYWDNDVGSNYDEGRAEVYHGSASGLSTTMAWSVSRNGSNTKDAISVASAGDVNADGYSDVLVSRWLNSNGQSAEGRAVLFHGSASGLSTTASWSAESNQSFADFGSRVSTAGDVNGDGFSDVLVAAVGYDNGETNEGRFYAFHGGSGGLSTTAAWAVESNQISGSLNNSQTMMDAATAGDVNGDGFSDVVVSWRRYDNGESDEGRVYAYHGSASGLSTTPVWSVEGNQASAQIGYPVRSAGDVDGDGFSDVLVGGPNYDNGDTNEGRAWLYKGSASGLSTSAAWVTEGDQAYDEGQTIAATYGMVSTAGDLNADGFSDVAVGAYGFDNAANTHEGAFFVFHGSEGTVAYNTYDLPGARRFTVSDGGNARFDKTGSRVVRDSSGFWYVAWQPRLDLAGADILLSYTTTSTPTSAGDWSTITLVDGSATGVINQNPANTKDGSTPCLAMSPSDELHLVWNAWNDFKYYWIKCTNLAAITDPTSWTSVRSIHPGTLTSNWYIDLALDHSGTPHIVMNNSGLLYSKSDTNGGAFLTAKSLASSAKYSPKISVDLDNNVYVIYHETAAPFNVSLLCSTNAYTTDPAGSIWKNLAQTTTDADVVNSTSTTLDAYTAADLCVDYNNICHVVWRVAPGNPNGQCIVARDGRIGQGFSSGPAQVSSPGPWKRPLAMVAIPDGSARLFSIANGGARNDAVYWTQYTGVGDPIEMGAWSVSPTAFSGLADGYSQAIWAERSMPRNQSDTMWFVANDAKHKISTSWTDRFAAAAKWSPPIQQKRQPHPHLAWVFPNTASDCGTLGLPTVSQTSKSCVYVMDPAGGTASRCKILAVDRSQGYLARSYYTGRTQNDPMVAAAWGGNVHLFVAQSTGNVLKLVDTGSDLLRDTAWANNPQDVATGSTIGSMSFLAESTGTRYLYVVASINPFITFKHWLHKLKADNGVWVWSENGLADYSMTTTEHPFRVLNDQIFIAGNTTGLYRRDSDGSGEISAVPIVNNVRKLIQVRNSDRLFVSPDDRVVYQLTSGLETTGWTSGKSANLGVAKTSGAYYSTSANILYVGAGNQLYRLNAADGAILSNWPMPYTGCIPVLPVKWKTFVYFGMSTGRLFAVNSTTNVARANWPVVLDTTNGTPAVRTSAFDAVFGHVYFSTDEGRIYKLSLE